MQIIINAILALLKWPLCLLMVWLIVPALRADIAVLYQGLTLPVLAWFFLPLLLVIVIWLLFPSLGASALAILEHEVTHMLFAVLTFHKPQDIRIQRGLGGQFIYTGKGNWLISISPYFFPTSSALVIGIGGFYAYLVQTPSPFYWLILGITTGFHVISTLAEIHKDQPDFHAVGRLFAILFLPGANLLTYGFLLAYACYGFAGWPLYLDLLLQESRDLLTLFLN